MGIQTFKKSMHIFFHFQVAAVKLTQWLFMRAAKLSHSCEPREILKLLYQILLCLCGQAWGAGGLQGFCEGDWISAPSTAAWDFLIPLLLLGLLTFTSTPTHFKGCLNVSNIPVKLGRIGAFSELDVLNKEIDTKTLCFSRKALTQSNAFHYPWNCQGCCHGL